MKICCLAVILIYLYPVRCEIVGVGKDRNLNCFCLLHYLQLKYFQCQDFLSAETSNFSTVGYTNLLILKEDIMH